MSHPSMFSRWWWRLTLKEWPWLELMTLKLLKHIVQVSRPRVWVRTSFQWKVSDDIMASPETCSFSMSGVVEMVTRCQSCIKMSRVILAHQVGRPSPDALQKQEIPPSQERKVCRLRNTVSRIKNKCRFWIFAAPLHLFGRNPSLVWHMLEFVKTHRTASEWPPKQLQCLQCFLDAACSSELYDHYDHFLGCQMIFSMIMFILFYVDIFRDNYCLLGGLL